MSKKDKREAKDQAKMKHGHQHGSKAGVQFKKLTAAELAEFMSRRAAGETEQAIAADLKRRKRA